MDRFISVKKKELDEIAKNIENEKESRLLIKMKNKTEAEFEEQKNQLRESLDCKLSQKLQEY